MDRGGPIRNWTRARLEAMRGAFREQVRLLDLRAENARDAVEPRCNICGGSEFGLGPGNRKSVLGHPPRCTHCQSLERHRSIRRVWSLFPRPFLAERNALQFSPDRSVDSTWFASYEVSTYGGANHLDLQDIDRPDGSYSIVICNHVLEHVEDDTRAFHELMRVICDDGFLQLTVPDPAARETTDDWGYARDDLHGHYRHYGMDLVDKFTALDTRYRVVTVRSTDPATGTTDPVFFWVKQPAMVRRLSRLLLPARGARALPFRAARSALGAARRIARPRNKVARGTDAE